MKENPLMPRKRIVKPHEHVVCYTRYYHGCSCGAIREPQADGFGVWEGPYVQTRLTGEQPKPRPKARRSK